MSQPSDIGTLAVKVGEISGQLRELIHKQNNFEMKLDGLVERSHSGPSAADFAAALSRISALEAKESERRGAVGIAAAILKSPAVGWLVGAALAVYATIKGP